ncbi:MAG: tetratricopeptide repeat protein [Deltaproteobacteria bacterium]|nr:tetratricopeptide repeat protein [Deltaproteobacteria bacterium]
MADVEMLKGLIEVPQPEAALLLEAGYLFMEMGKPKDAEEVFAGVAALLPESDVPLVALGNLEFSQGHYQRALKHHQEALKVKPGSALAQAHVGEALLWLKKGDEGAGALKKAIAMEPGGAAAAFARALLDAWEQGAIGR